MEFLFNTVTYILPFLVVLTVLVFVHEMGHYSVARWNGVRVEVFSIGFGPELFGWDDKHGTRWKISAVPLGGYVKFFGDEDAASVADNEALGQMSDAEKAVSFHHQALWPRIAIVAAGPLANFVYAIVVLAVLFMVFGQRLTPSEIGTVIKGSVGEAAGFRRGDVVLEVDGRSIDRFERLFEEIALNPERTLDFLVLRDGREHTITATPEVVERDGPDDIVRKIGNLGLLPSYPAIVEHVFPDSPAEDAGVLAGDKIVNIDGHPVGDFEDLRAAVVGSAGRSLSFVVLRDGGEVKLAVTPREDVRDGPDGKPLKRWLVGIVRARPAPVQLGLVAAFQQSVTVSYDMLDRTLIYVGQMISGSRGTEDLGGPLRIAQASGQAAKVGIEQVIMLSVLLSLNLGLINLFPIPILDGGHLLFYALEGIRGRPLTEKMQDYAFRVGLALVMTLMVFATWNDLVNLRVVDFFSGLFS